VVAFTVERSFIKDTTMFGVPVVALDEVVSQFPPDTFRMFVAVGYGRVNKEREQRYHQVKDLGYELISYVSSKAITYPGLEIGENCFIMEGNIIQPFVTIGNDVMMWAGCHIGHETIIKDHCFLSAHAVVSGNVVIEPNCFLGVNATIRNAITIARESVIGAGSVILKSTQERSVYLSPKAELAPMTSDRIPGL